GPTQDRVLVEPGSRPRRHRVVCGVGVAAETRVELAAAVEADRHDVQWAGVVDAAGLVVDGRAQHPDGGGTATAAREFVAPGCRGATPVVCRFVRGHATESASVTGRVHATESASAAW